MAVPARHLRLTLFPWFTLRHWRRQIVFWVGALLVGLLAVALTVGADNAQRLFSAARGREPWLPLLITPVGFALSAWATRRWFPGAQGSGIPQVIAANEMPRGSEPWGRLVSLWTVTGKSVLLLFGLLCGASIGREGPTVQIGAAVMRAAGLAGGVRRDNGLLLAGGAAGVAAAFNTPLAGVVFAIEELGRTFEQRTNGIVIFAVVLAGLASLALVGDYTYFGSSSAHLVGWQDAVAVAICGIGGGFLGGLFSRVLILGVTNLKGLARGHLAAHPIYFATGCGLIVAAIGVITHGAVFGTGYGQARHLMTGEDGISWLYGPLKVIATLLSSVSGIPGGLFAPSLSAGAGIGADFWHIFPVAPAATMILLGMVGYFAGVVQSPLTAFVIVMEMTGDRDMLIPLMATSLLAYGVSKLVCPEPVYHALAHAIIRREKAALPVPVIPQAAEA